MGRPNPQDRRSRHDAGNRVVPPSQKPRQSPLRHPLFRSARSGSVTDVDRSRGGVLVHRRVGHVAPFEQPDSSSATVSDKPTQNQRGPATPRASSRLQLFDSTARHHGITLASCTTSADFSTTANLQFRRCGRRALAWQRGDGTGVSAGAHNVRCLRTT